MPNAYIATIDIFTANLPFRFAFGHSLATRRSSENVYVRVTLDDGSVGYGEGVPRDYVTGETGETALAALTEIFAPSVIGRDVRGTADVLRLLRTVSHAKTNNLAAYCALELAVLDAFGHHFGCSVSRWLADAPAERVRYDAIIPFGGVPHLAVLGTLVRAFGFSNAKLKVGRDVERDAQKIGVLRRVLGPRVDIRVDANCAWTEAEALGAIERFRRYGISSVEQPVAADDMVGLQYLTRATEEAIIVDESLCSLEDARRLAENRACNAFNIRVSKCGGLLNSLEIARVAHVHGLACVVGAQVGESGILSAAGRHLAAAIPDVMFVEGSAGRLLLKEDLTMENVLPGKGGWARTFRGPGLGVHVRPDLFSRLGRHHATLDACGGRVAVAS
jgi:L-alanine-DL-glutamate epimerase-like enolase superfamily enzyme